MILKENNNREIVLGASEEKMFSVDSSNSVIFEILRNKMYSNKIGSIAREVASNSRDANIEAGNDQPIEIEFTNNNILSMIGNTSIIFRDFGIGISPERMEDVFLKYGASTKRDTNLQTGGFGLGAKTPFAYTDSFVIKTINDGVEYFYNAIIDATGKGKMILLSEGLTDCPSGTEIIIPILSNEDRSKFEMEVYNSTMYWGNVKYINFNSTKPVVEYLMEDEDFRLTRRRQASFVGLLDGIPYEVKPDNIKGLQGITVFLNLDLDKLTINANRETLQYDEQTQAHVNEKAQAFFDKLKEKIEDYLSDNSTYLGAYKKFKTVIKGGYYDFDDNRGNNVIENIIMSAKSSGYGYNFSVYFGGQEVERLVFVNHQILEAKAIVNGFKYNPISFTPDLPIVYLDKGGIRLNKNEKIGEKFLLIKPVKNNDAEEIKKELDTLKNLGVDIINYSDIKPDRATVKKVKSGKAKIFLRGFSDPYENKFDLMFDKTLKVLESPYDVSSTVVIPVNKFENRNRYRYRYSSGGNVFRGNYWQDRVTILRFEKKIERIVYVTNTAYDKYLREAGYKTLEEVFATVDLQKYANRLDDSEISYLISSIPPIILKNFDELLPKSLIALRDHKSTQDDLSNVEWNKFGLTKSKFDYDGVQKKFERNIEQKYPMLMPYIWNSGNHKEEQKIKNIKNYIKSC